MRKIAVISVLLALASAMFVPSILASPANANLSWSPPAYILTSGVANATTATYGVGAGPDCPTGDFFSGALTVTDPRGGVSSITQTDIPCGTVDLSTGYPSGFTGIANDDECSTYTAVWAGSTTAVVNGVHPTFNVRAGFVRVCLAVPEFGTPAILVGAVGLVVVAAMKRGKILKL